MSHPRFEFALGQLRAEHWRLFERLASEFLVDEFPSLRTTASPSGDGGRDGEVFQVDEDPRTGFQYSVTVDWRPKIRATIRTLQVTFPKLRRLIYCTSQEIGAQADDLRTEAWNDFGVQLDVRDRNWFIERAATSVQRATASEELAVAIADPLLQERKLVKVIATPLSNEESRVALLQLALNARDRETDRGITKTSFESLVKAALVGTSAEDMRTLGEVQSVVCSYLPGANAAQVDALTLSALNRMVVKRGPVKQRTDTKSYHLSFEEAQQWKESAAAYLLDQCEVEADLAAGAYGLDTVLDQNYELLRAEAVLLRQALESLLLQRGEAFVDAVHGNSEPTTSLSELSELVAALDLPLRLSSDSAAQAIGNVLAGPSDRTKNHLTRVLDAYTLFAFLQQTPDVQKTLSRVFSGGEIWLDTTAILPLLGEMLIEEPSKRNFTNLLGAARESGISLAVTDGVIEEIEAHLENSLLYIRMAGEWRTRIPFVYSAYMLSGRAEGSFPAWVSDIKGTDEPMLDVELFLGHHFGIEKRNLSYLADAADTELRGAVQELWRQSARRNRRGASDSSTHRLISHDVENVVGVIEHRKGSPASPLGYSAWWLTLDGRAFKLKEWLLDQLGKNAPASPVMSPDYLAQILRLGPLRRELGVRDITTMPLTMSIRMFEDVPPELIGIAKATREKFLGFDELRIQREVRDALNRSRTPLGKESDYASVLEAEIADSLQPS
ncbi:hypothetical protein E3T43_08625 [Cryobacterium sp. Hh7]|uniref:hypothetical protein n=1 Tax=Cryobacterium sp. Hh7 TaxID=1259159 RepID=UPI00106ABCFA|nr:hypothetical protein [Cryobacterium sp. Hh7]TFD56978.1 hypothetical protein E3T43_08625 [Cryobacterium sp. Hh7]